MEEFLEQHPEYECADESALMIARIKHEHAERDKLEQARQELLKTKQGLIADNMKRKDDLASLDKDLEKFIDVCSLTYSKTKLLGSRCRLQNLFRKYSKRNTSP